MQIQKNVGVIRLSSVILVLLLGQPRIFLSMAKDGLLPGLFARVHPSFRTPYISQILTGIIAKFLLECFRSARLASLFLSVHIAFVIVCVSIIVLRKSKPDIPRPFKTPLVPLIPILGILSCFLQMAFLSAETWWRLIIWMTVGFVVYFSYSMHGSKLRKSLQAEQK